MHTKCYKCGLPDDQFGSFLMLPNDLWQDLAKEDPRMLLCANCICQALKGTCLFVVGLNAIFEYEDHRELVRVKYMKKKQSESENE